MEWAREITEVVIRSHEQEYQSDTNNYSQSYSKKRNTRTDRCCSETNH